MSTLAVETHPLAQSVEFSNDDLIVSLLDGRKVTVPLIWFPRLAEATKTQLENYELLGGGEGIHWPEIEKISALPDCCEGITRLSVKHN